MPTPIRSGVGVHLFHTLVGAKRKCERYAQQSKEKKHPWKKGEKKNPNLILPAVRPDKTQTVFSNSFPMSKLTSVYSVERQKKAQLHINAAQRQTLTERGRCNPIIQKSSRHGRRICVCQDMAGLRHGVDVAATAIIRRKDEDISRKPSLQPRLYVPGGHCTAPFATWQLPSGCCAAAAADSGLLASRVPQWRHDGNWL